MRSKVWIGVGVALAAGSMTAPLASAGAPHVASGPAAKLWQVADKAVAAGQGGEGGEAGLAAPAAGATDVAFAVGMAELSAHLALADELLGNGDAAAAAERLQHGLESVYAPLKGRFADNKIEPFEVEWTAAIDAAKSGKDLPVFEKARALLSRRLAQATLTAAPVSVMSGLAKQAAVEYAEAIENGRFKALPEYQYAYVFIRTAAAHLARARQDLAVRDKKATDDLAALVASLRSAVSSIAPPDNTVITPAEFAAIASKVELKASRFAK